MRQLGLQWHNGVAEANSPGVELTCGLPNTKKLCIFIIFLFETVLVFFFPANGTIIYKLHPSFVSLASLED